MQWTTSSWRFLFFVGIILLNVLLYFRSTAFATGGTYRIVWTGLVILTGAGLLISIFRMRDRS